MGGEQILARLLVLLALSDQMSPQLDAVMSNAERVAGRMKSVGANMTAAFTVPILGIGTAAATAFGEFEKSMNVVQAVINPTAVDLAALKQVAMDMGAATQFSATQAAEALGELGKAGFDSKAAIAALPATLDLAASAQMSMKDAAELGAQVLKQFGLEASDLSTVTDILSEAANRSAVDVTQLRESLKFVGPVASALGVSFNDTAAALAVLGDAGFKADMSGTALRNMFTRLVDPPKAMETTLKRLAISVTDSTGNFRPLADVVDDFKAKLALIPEPAERAATVMGAFGARAGPSFLALLEQGGDALRRMEGDLERSAGAAQRTRDIMMEGLGGALERMKGSVETAAIALGEALAPALITVTGWVERAANWVGGTLVPAFAGLPEPVQLVVIGILAVVAAIGPLLVIGGTLLGAIGPIVALFGGWSAIMAGVATAIGLVLSPIGLVVAAVVGLGLVWLKWGDDIKLYVSQAYAAVKEWLWDKFGPTVEAVSGFLSTLGGYWTTFKDGAIGAAQSATQGATSWLVDKFEPITGPIGEVFDSLGEMFHAHNRLVGAVLGLVIDKVTGWVGDMRDWLGPKIRVVFEAVRAIVELLVTYHVEMFRIVIGKVTDFMADLRDWFGPKLRVIVTAVKTVIDPIVSFFTTVKDGVLRVAELLYTGVKTYLLDKFLTIVEGVKGAIDRVTGFFADLTDKVVGHSYIVELVDGIAHHIGRLDAVMVRPAQEAAGHVAQAFNDLNETTSLETLGRNFANTLDNMRVAAGGWKDRLLDIWTEFRDGVQDRIQSITDKFGDSMARMLTGQVSLKGGLIEIWEAIRDAILGVIGDLISKMLTQWLSAIGIISRPPGSTPGTTPVPTPAPPTPGPGTGFTGFSASASSFLPASAFRSSQQAVAFHEGGVNVTVNTRGALDAATMQRDVIPALETAIRRNQRQARVRLQQALEIA